MEKHDHPWWAPEIEAWLALISLLIFGAVTAYVLAETVPAQNEKYAMLLLGALIGIVKDTFARYFNTTKGASEQRETIAAMARTTEATAAAAVAPLTRTTTTTTEQTVDSPRQEEPSQPGGGASPAGGGGQASGRNQ